MTSSRDGDTGGAASAPGRMGERLIRSGLMTLEQVQRTIQLQHDEQLPFGEAAVRLGFLNEQDVQAVLAEQFNYAAVLTSDADISPLLAIARQPFGAEAEAIRRIRVSLLMKMGERPRFSVAVVSPAEGEGKTYLATSLAVAFSQSGQRTLLVNANLRSSGQNDLYGLARQRPLSGPEDDARPALADIYTQLANADAGVPDDAGRKRTPPQKGQGHELVGLSNILAKRSSLRQLQTVTPFPQLSVLQSGPQPPNPLELLAEPNLRTLLDGFDGFEVIIVDTPAALDTSDAQVIARQCDACVVVARKDVTRLRDLRTTWETMHAAGVVIAGSVYCSLDGGDAPLAKWERAVARLRSWVSRLRSRRR